MSVIPGEGGLALSEDGTGAMHGREYELLAPLMDGSRDEDALVDALVDALAGEVGRDESVLCPGVDGKERPYRREPPGRLAGEGGILAWHGDRTGCRDGIARIGAGGSTGVRTVGKADGAPLRKALEDLRIELSENETADFEAVVTDDTLHLELDALNETSLRLGRPWLLVKTTGHEIWIGPLFVPGKTACILREFQTGYGRGFRLWSLNCSAKPGTVVAPSAGQPVAPDNVLLVCRPIGLDIRQADLPALAQGEDVAKNSRKLFRRAYRYSDRRSGAWRRCGVHHSRRFSISSLSLP